jgi:hypothetical protein
VNKPEAPPVSACSDGESRQILRKTNDKKEIVTDIVPARVCRFSHSANNLSDLWEIRLCFHQHYRHRLHFLVFEDRNEIVGMIPCLSCGRDRASFSPEGLESEDGLTDLGLCRNLKTGYLLSECPDHT